MSPERWVKGIDVAHPGRITPGLARVVRWFLDPLVRLCHRPTFTGVRNLPRGPYLLVANHSAGVGIAEINTFIAMYLRHVGSDRPLAGFAHPVGFRLFPLYLLWRSLGTIPSTYSAARSALTQGVPVLVFPGGDYETLRPIWRANTVDFGGRTGFLRIARERRLPIVPLGIRGGHFTAPILFSGRWLSTLLVVPRLLGVKRWAVSLLGVIVSIVIAAQVSWPWPLRLALIWLWLGSPLTYMPWVPWNIHMSIGKPIPPGDLFLGETPDEQLQYALQRVQAEVQDLVDFPVVKDDASRS